MTSHDRKNLIVYIVADNNMSWLVQSDINEMLYGAQYLGSKDHLVLYVDDKSLPRIYDITASDFNQTYSSLKPIYSYNEEKNSCSTQQMNHVLNYIKNNYPAPSFGLVLWSHGSGWIPKYGTVYEGQNFGSKRRSFGIDQNLADSKTTCNKVMEIDSLKIVLDNYKVFDFIMFDACFMQNIEVDYALRDVTKSIIASPAEIPGPGAPYHTVLKPMFEDNDYVVGMVSAYHYYYSTSTNYGLLLSAVDVDKIQPFSDITRTYIQKYKEELMTMSYDSVQNYFHYDKYYDSASKQYPDYYDINGVMQTAMSDEDYAVWYAEFQKILRSYTCTSFWYSDVMGKTKYPVDVDQYRGVSIHIPLKKYADDSVWFASAYYFTEWARKVWL